LFDKGRRIFLLIRFKELKHVFSDCYTEYFHLIKITKEKGDTMLNSRFLSLIINDILATEEYTLEGIANYTNVHTDVLYEILAGLNLTPSADLLQRNIELHRSVRYSLYESIIKKIIHHYLTEFNPSK